MSFLLDPGNDKLAFPVGRVAMPSATPPADAAQDDPLAVQKKAMLDVASAQLGLLFTAPLPTLSIATTEQEVLDLAFSNPFAEMTSLDSGIPASGGELIAATDTSQQNNGDQQMQNQHKDPSLIDLAGFEAAVQSISDPFSSGAITESTTSASSALVDFSTTSMTTNDENKSSLFKFKMFDTALSEVPAEPLIQSGISNQINDFNTDSLSSFALPLAPSSSQFFSDNASSIMKTPFQEFENIHSTTVVPSTAKADEFGDFGGANAMSMTEDDGFGDFAAVPMSGGQQNFTLQLSVSEAIVPQVATTATLLPVDGVDYTFLLNSLSDAQTLLQNRVSVAADMTKLLDAITSTEAYSNEATQRNKCEALIQQTETTTEDGNTVRQAVPNNAFRDELWFTLWTELTSQPIFDEHISIKVRWKKSNIRKLFLKSLDVVTDDTYERIEKKMLRTKSNTSVNTVDSQPVLINGQAPVPPIVNTNTGSSIQLSRSMQTLLSSPMSPLPNLESIANLCELSEDDLNNRTIEELQSIQGSLVHAVPRINAQINYFLDAKEQLSMDSEMHNKVISVMVQQAQKTHQMMAKKGMSPPKTSLASRSRKGTSASSQH